jgi:hypothetical protein
MNHRLEEIVQSINPTTLLDVGCGCGGHLTSTLVRHCARVVAIDVAPHMSRWQEISRSSGVVFCCMDATAIGFASESFPLVVERDTLHHIARWTEVLAEMLRVSSGRILFQEPIDDLRSEAKRRTYEAQGLFLEVQAESGYPHFRHLSRESMLTEVQSQAVLLEAQVERSDASVGFDEFFESFGAFAKRTSREGYWLDRLRELRSRFGGAALCEDDRLTVLAAKLASPTLP